MPKRGRMVDPTSKPLYNGSLREDLRLKIRYDVMKMNIGQDEYDRIMFTCVKVNGN